MDTSVTADERTAAYQTRFSDTSDTLFFFIAFLLGIGSIIFLKEMDIDQVAVTAAPVAILIAYAVFLFATRRGRARADRAGDNLYYLGFLYTLTSLAQSLYVFLSLKEKGGVDAILSNFGIALSTTILGLALRVIFNQIREDPLAVEHEARINLAEAASSLRTTLFDMVNEFNSFRRSLQQSLLEGMEEVSSKSSEALEKQTTRFKEVTDEALTGIGTAFSDFKGSSDEFLGQSKPMASAAKRLLKRLEAIDLPEDILEKKFDRVFELLATNLEQRTGETLGHFGLTLDGMLKRLNTDLSSQTQLLGETTKSVQTDLEACSFTLNSTTNEFQKHSKAVVTDIEALSRRVNAIHVPPDLFERKFQPLIDNLSSRIEETTQQVDSQTAQAKRLEEITNSLIESSDKLNRSISAVTLSIESRASSARQEASELEKGLSTFQSSVDSIFKSFREGGEQQSDTLKALGKETEETLTIARQHRVALEKELESSLSLLGEFSQTLVSLSRIIVEKLR